MICANDRPLADKSLMSHLTMGRLPMGHLSLSARSRVLGCSPAPFDAVDQRLVAQKNAFCLAAPRLIQRFQQNDEEVPSLPWSLRADLASR